MTADAMGAFGGEGILNREDPRPLHRQLHAAILEAIEAGRLPRNGKLPSERTLVDIFGVSRITVRHAIRDLVAQGVVQSQPGKGLYVVDPWRGFELQILKSFTATALANGRRPENRLIDARIAEAPLEISRPLLLPIGAEVIVLSACACSTGAPWSSRPTGCRRPVFRVSWSSTGAPATARSMASCGSAIISVRCAGRTR